MMQSACHRLLENRSQFRCLEPPRDRAVLLQPKMGAGSVMVLELAPEHAP
jgi:hypothetical protein